MVEGSLTATHQRPLCRMASPGYPFRMPFTLPSRLATRCRARSSSGLAESRRWPESLVAAMMALASASCGTMSFTARSSRITPFSLTSSSQLAAWTCRRRRCPTLMVCATARSMVPVSMPPRLARISAVCASSVLTPPKFSWMAYSDSSTSAARVSAASRSLSACVGGGRMLRRSSRPLLVCAKPDTSRHSAGHSSIASVATAAAQPRSAAASAAQSSSV
mmetsp:Transcript_30411/g.78650  ORF Transcript_30411/g.78650 Transcript_30411/m.78650 type:complete len:220 (-) Transcript_30411:308-967(-)